MAIVGFLESQKNWDLLKPLITFTVLSPLCARMAGCVWKDVVRKGVFNVHGVFFFFFLLL